MYPLALTSDLGASCPHSPGGVLSKEASRCADVALKREIVRPRIPGSRGLSDNAFGLRHINRMQQEAR